MNPEIKLYIQKLEETDKKICTLLTNQIDQELKEAENKIWHAHPVWFLHENPIVGFSKQKRGIRLMFWSGADFEENSLDEIGKKFKDASIFYNNAKEINITDLNRWLKKSRKIQWDYKNLVKRKGRLEKLQIENAKTIKKSICVNGHEFPKSTDCPTCPICENNRKPKEGFMAILSAPARRALENAGIITLKKLSKYSELELLGLHGLGKTSIPKLKSALMEIGLSLKK